MDGRRILLVDDESLVCDFAVAALGARGWRVDCAGSVAEARAGRTAAPEARYHLILCDVELPDGDGIALAEELSLDQPQAHVILTSGWPERYEDHETLHRCDFRFLAKPFSMVDLFELVGVGPVPPPGGLPLEGRP